MLRVAALTVVLILLSYPNLAQDRQTVEEHYSAVVMGTGEPMEGRSLQFDFRIERYASDEQVNSFARRLKDRGQDALGSALQRGCRTDQLRRQRRQPNCFGAQASGRFRHNDRR